MDTFQKRMGLIGNGARLIIPISCTNRGSFPAEVQDFQDFDFSPFTSTIRKYWESERAIEADQLVKRVAEVIALVVNAPPPRDRGWPVSDPRQFLPDLVKMAPLGNRQPRLGAA
jgi:hypothetical protein